MLRRVPGIPVLPSVVIVTAIVVVEGLTGPVIAPLSPHSYLGWMLLFPT